MSNMKVYQPYYPKHPITSTHSNKEMNSGQVASFENLLKHQIEKSDKVKFSTHAKQRLEKRGINVDLKMLESLNTAIAKAETKGAKDSLVLYQNLAFVVNVPNRTVITAVDEASMKEHIFTNIDSAVII